MKFNTKQLYTVTAVLCAVQVFSIPSSATPEEFKPSPSGCTKTFPFGKIPSYCTKPQFIVPVKAERQKASVTQVPAAERAEDEDWVEFDWERFPADEPDEEVHVEGADGEFVPAHDLIPAEEVPADEEVLPPPYHAPAGVDALVPGDDLAVREAHLEDLEDEEEEREDQEEE